jgi:hypothetical protein
MTRLTTDELELFKLACLYAALAHPDMTFAQVTDMLEQDLSFRVDEMPSHKKDAIQYIEDYFKYIGRIK